MIKKLRLIVERCTPKYIYAIHSPLCGDAASATDVSGVSSSADASESSGISASKRYVVDWSDSRFLYLRKILKPSVQINVLDATQLITNAVIFPRYIIVEPDFLLDISSVAGCFKEYGHHSLNYTVSRLAKTDVTQPILLGNYAGAALDDVVHSTVLSQQEGGEEGGAAFPFAKVLSHCFQEQPLEYVSCAGFNATQFKKDAVAQAQNIQQIVRSLAEKYDLNKAILEPTFVCESLGLQGRVDMMTTDFRLLIEQKSGKNFNLATSQVSDIGYHIESHYVQLLLYFSVLYFNFGITKEDISFFLLYSKYQMPTGLLPV